MRLDFRENTSCVECLEIIRQYKEAYAEASEKNRTAVEALRSLIGGTEDDAQRADQLMSPYRPQPFASAPDWFAEVTRKYLDHLVRTGHVVKFTAARI